MFQNNSKGVNKIDNQNLLNIILTNDEKDFIIIPQNIVENSKIDNKCVAAYTFFWFWVGRSKKVMFTIESLVSWCGYIPKSNKGKINEQFGKILSWLEDIGYITYSKIDNSRYPYTTLLTADLHSDWYKSMTDANYFAMVYLDEINKIMNYDCGNKSKTLTNANILAVFAYLRLRIPIRNATEGESEERRINTPEVFYSYYKDISEELGISEKTLSTILRILSKELDLIYIQRIKRKNTKDKDGTTKWITLPTLFCNTYKRLRGKLIYSGSDYYSYEIQNKLNKINFTSIEKVNTKTEDSETDIDTKWLYDI